MKLVFTIKDGEHREMLLPDPRNETINFNNDIEANRERLRFYAQHCSGRIELSQEEFDRSNIPQVIPIVITDKK